MLPLTVNKYIEPIGKRARCVLAATMMIQIILISINAVKEDFDYGCRLLYPLSNMFDVGKLHCCHIGQKSASSSADKILMIKYLMYRE